LEGSYAAEDALIAANCAREDEVLKHRWVNQTHLALNASKCQGNTAVEATNRNKKEIN